MFEKDKILPYDIWSNRKPNANAVKDENGFIVPGTRGDFVSSLVNPKPPHNALKWEAKNIVLKEVCPFCNGRAHLSTRVQDFDGQPIAVAYYECVFCDECFTTTEIDNITILPLLSKKRRLKKVMEIINQPK